MSSKHRVIAHFVVARANRIGFEILARRHGSIVRYRLLHCATDAVVLGLYYDATLTEIDAYLDRYEATISEMGGKADVSPISNTDQSPQENSAACQLDRMS
ncbi:hypothetical protein IB238_05715 [Rhizobium sp. ARZ01]|uniref:hypothetical protein n=1 Tax=Rhizobium sp. ARZ01 TaxID=2769313 RepID=UPI00177E1C7D|nr:hypothetical protein [Rhizobium sp. ARZ01]MBD9372127.1 hypothetical protein [Rhizobium sp. ARZ01]